MTRTSGKRCLVDTNVLLEATDRARAHHVAAKRFLENGRSFVVAAQVVREYFVVATRPTLNNGLGMTFEDARSNVEAFLGLMTLVPEEKATLPTLLALLSNVSCTGKQIHDAHIVATAIVHRVPRLATFNVGDFARFSSHVEAISP